MTNKQVNVGEIFQKKERLSKREGEKEKERQTDRLSD